MGGDDDLEPILRYAPTGDALDLAEKLARALGEPFDRAAVAAQSETLHETMFADLAASLGLEASDVMFRSGVYSRARAFVGRSAAGVTYLSLDLVFDFVIAAAGHIVVVLAIVELEPDEVRRLHRALDDVFSLFVDNHRFKTLRESVRPLLTSYHHCLNLSHALTRSMTVSVLCHELAHLELRHLERLATAELELEADTRGAELFLRHVRDGGARGRTSVYVDPKLVAAPVLLLRIFDLYEAWLAQRGSPIAQSAIHPPAALRADRVEAILRPHLVEKAAYILDGMTATLLDMKQRL